MQTVGCESAAESSRSASTAKQPLGHHSSGTYPRFLRLHRPTARPVPSNPLPLLRREGRSGGPEGEPLPSEDEGLQPIVSVPHPHHRAMALRSSASPSRPKGAQRVQTGRSRRRRLPKLARTLAHMMSAVPALARSQNGVATLAPQWHSKLALLTRSLPRQQKKPGAAKRHSGPSGGVRCRSLISIVGDRRLEQAISDAVHDVRRAAQKFFTNVRRPASPASSSVRDPSCVS